MAFQQPPQYYAPPSPTPVPIPAHHSSIEQLLQSPVHDPGTFIKAEGRRTYDAERNRRLQEGHNSNAASTYAVRARDRRIRDDLFAQVKKDAHQKQGLINEVIKLRAEIELKQNELNNLHVTIQRFEVFLRKLAKEFWDNLSSLRGQPVANNGTSKNSMDNGPQPSPNIPDPQALNNGAGEYIPAG